MCYVVHAEFGDTEVAGKIVPLIEDDKLNNSLSPTIRLLLGLACLAIVLAGLRWASPMFNRLVFSLIIATTTLPLIGWLRRKGASSVVALVITIAAISLILVVVVGLMGFGVSSMAKAIPSYAAEMERLPASIETGLFDLGLDVPGAMQTIFDQVGLGQLLDLILSSLIEIVGTVANFAITFIIIIFLLIDSLGIPKKMAEFTQGGNVMMDRVGGFGRSIQKYVIITGMIGVVIAVLNVLLLVILGVDFPLLWGVLAFLLNFVPLIGYWLALIPPMLLGTLELGLPVGVAVFLGYWIINGSAENLIKPKIMGEGLDISPATVFLSVVLWSALLGPMGALLGVPLTLAIKELVLEADESTAWIAGLMSSGTRVDDEKTMVEAGRISDSDE